MAYNQYLADRIAQRLTQVNHSETKKMMGGLIFMVNNKMCLGLDFDKTSQTDRLMVRVGKLAHDRLIFKKGSTEMNFTGKTMRGFFFITPEGFDRDNDLDFWVEKALDFNRQLCEIDAAKQ